MGLLPPTGRTAPGQRLLRAALVLSLAVGALAMALPFGFMLAGTTRTGVDQHRLNLIPRFLFDDDALFRKYIEALYNESPSALRAAWETDPTTFSEVERLPESDENRVREWEAFLHDRGLRPHERHTGFSYTPTSRGRPWMTRRFLNFLRDRHRGDVDAMNAELGTGFPDWNAFQVLPPDTRSREGLQDPTPWWNAWDSFTATRAPAWTQSVHNLGGYYHERILRVREGRDAPRVPLPALGESEAREVFLRAVVHPDFVHMRSGLVHMWRNFLEARYGGLNALAQATGQREESWDTLDLPETRREAGPLAADWMAFLEGWVDPATGLRWEAAATSLRLDSPDIAWREATGTTPPIREWDQWKFERHKGEIRRVFLFQNFAAVYEILVRDGRGLWVTVVYCGGAVLLALIVNPLAAYALSRYRPKHTYTVLLYLLLTMAFPPMVTQIPLFLLLRDLGLLNTFWALLLPGMAHGYSIFLLKGFFDSLPRDLYESAALDGAGELRMFGMITLALSKPILAVIALTAFVQAYSAFMFALLICQDDRMWTLMVWLYQLQQTYGPGVQNAAYLLAAVPTLVVFLLAQRHIMRGIVVPTEK